MYNNSDMDTSFDEMRKYYFVGLRRNSYIILDSVGINTDRRLMRSWSTLQKIEGYLYGHGRGLIYRFWCKHLRRYVAPGEQMALEDRLRFYEKIVDTQLQMSFLEQGKRLGYIK